jgi:L-seryl-tRNA(Ser) seleniumtransferase
VKPAVQDALRRLPGVDQGLRQLREQGFEDVPRWALLSALCAEIAALRRAILSEEVRSPMLDSQAIARRAQALCRSSLRPLVNATGIVLHTNLGRAPLPRCAIDQLGSLAGHYTNLEYDLAAGHRGSRHGHLVELLQVLTGAEDAVAVNNNAAAVLVSLAALAGDGKEVVVSRGELIEIGGSFRLPDVMAASGARLREVGTTNRTHLADYRRAVSKDTALLFKAHQSNFAQLGFTKQVGPRELVELGRELGLPTMFDLGSGTLIDLGPHGVGDEPTVPQMVAAGFDLVTFSGDKLLGAVQAGLIVGRRDLVDRVRSHPLMRAVRPGALVVAALEACLRLYRDGRAAEELPGLSLLIADEASIRARAEHLRRELGQRLATPWQVELHQVQALAGGGSLPDRTIPSWAVSIEHPEWSAQRLEQVLRAADPPIIGRIETDRLILDLRAVAVDELNVMAESIIDALGRSGGSCR